VRLVFQSGAGGTVGAVDLGEFPVSEQDAFRATEVTIPARMDPLQGVGGGPTRPGTYQFATKPLLPKRQRRRRWPGRKPLDDRACLNGILFVLATGIRWDRLPQQLGYGSGMTCWRRLRDWQAAGVWERLHALLLAELHAAGRIDWSRAVADSSHIRAKRGTTRSGQARSTGAAPAASITC
jgi:transposase